MTTLRPPALALAGLLLAAGCAGAPTSPTPVPPLPAPASTAPVAATTAPADTTTATAPADPADLVTEASADSPGFGLLKAVRLAGQDGVDRIVFEFDGAVPGYRISYADLPVTSDPAGEEVPLAGGAALQVSLIGSSAYAQLGDPQPAYPVARRIAGGDTSQVTELVNLGDFERVLVWAAGVRERTGFRVSTLNGPPRLVIDVAH
ncbi:AMIN-like domain-containing (lipo)protein [Pseudonocardia broussonetiae]|uniref:AMIN-like domain-containing protein n=1 Tax=Pseudonocardia broussonetiae TaxID=2736640 RepID=A0A6M6JGS7_9PSEU|nr:hypothetical protein [Pseudonocardia broussonetiae]QJY46250.1 hypothetical protein HOP40_10910 [Pseudonocardia broussonetiae]